MSIALKFDFTNDPRLNDPTFLKGIKFRQQQAHKVVRTVEGAKNDDPSQAAGQVVTSDEWRFDPEEVKPEKHPRALGADGKPVELPIYIVHISYGLKNLVLEKKGKVEHLHFRNPSLRNQVRIKIQALVEVKKDKTGKPIKEWQTQGAPTYLAANQWGGVMVGDGIRAILDEMPT